MADFNYILTLADIGIGLVDLVGDTIKLVLCTAGYTANVSTDHYLTAISAGARVASVTLTGKSFTNGIFDADDVTFVAPASGQTITQAVLYQDASPSSGARLIRKISADTVAGFPFTTTGSDVLLAWPNDANKIFRFVNA